MTPDSKIALLQPKFVDSIISTENPNVANFTIFQVVPKLNMNSLCSAYNAYAVLIDDGMCTKPLP